MTCNSRFLTRLALLLALLALSEMAAAQSMPRLPGTTVYSPIGYDPNQFLQMYGDMLLRDLDGAANGTGGPGEMAAGDLDMPHTLPGVAPCQTEPLSREQEVTVLYMAQFGSSTFSRLRGCAAANDAIGEYFLVRFVSPSGAHSTGVYQRSDSNCASGHQFFEHSAPSCR